MIPGGATVFDTETALFEPGLMAPPIACVSFPDRLAYPKDLDLSGTLIGANLAYDMACLAADDPTRLPEIFRAYAEGRVRDVLIRQKLIDIAMGCYRGTYDQKGKRVQYGYSLADVYFRLTGNTLKKDDVRKGYGDLIGVPFDQWTPRQREYPIQDAEATRIVFEIQEQDVAKEGCLEIFNDEPAQCRAAFALHLASVWGIHTDEEGVRLLREHCQGILDEIYPKLELAGLVYTVGLGKRGQPLKDTGKRKRATRKAQARMLEAMGGWDKVKLTDKGWELRNAGQPWQEVKYVSVDEEACIDCGDEILFHYSTYTKVSNLLTGHVKAMEAGLVTPIHTRFEVLMETGRTSSSDPNIQNVRRAEGARECFAPREGCVFVGCDYDKAELHTLAQICINLFGRSQLAEALNGGLDPHLDVGAVLYGVTYEEALRLRAADDPAMDEYRSRAKPANFGFPGGMGPRGMVAYAKGQYGMILTLDQAEDMYSAWSQAYPDVAEEYLGYIRRMTAGGEMTVIHHVSGRWRGGCRYTVAANSHFQGLAADAAKAATFEVSRRCYDWTMKSPLYGCRIVNFIHDELLLEVPVGKVTEAALELQRVMIETFNRYTPDVPVRATPAAMDRWSKRAKPIWKDGELQVWHYERKVA